MLRYSPESIRTAIENASESDSARAALAKAARLESVPSSDVHALHAAAYDALTGGAFSRAAVAGDTEKVVQIVLSLHSSVQRSAINRERESYRGRSASSIAKGGRTTFEHFADALAESGDASK